MSYRDLDNKLGNSIRSSKKQHQSVESKPIKSKCWDAVTSNIYTKPKNGSQKIKMPSLTKKKIMYKWKITNNEWNIKWQTIDTEAKNKKQYRQIYIVAKKQRQHMNDTGQIYKYSFTFREENPCRKRKEDTLENGIVC